MEYRTSSLKIGRLSSAVVLVLMALSLFVAMSPSMSPGQSVRASVPAVSTTVTGTSASGTTATTASLTPTAGDFVVITAFSDVGGAGANAPTLTVTESAGGDTISKAVYLQPVGANSCNTNLSCTTGIWYFSAVTGAARTFTVTASAATSGGLYITASDILTPAGISYNYVTNATGASSGTSITTSSSISYSGAELLVNSIGAGSGVTAITGSVLYASCNGGGVRWCAAYTTPSVSGSSNFPATNGANAPYIIVAAKFVVVSSTTVTTTGTLTTTTTAGTSSFYVGDVSGSQTSTKYALTRGTVYAAVGFNPYPVAATLGNVTLKLQNVATTSLAPVLSAALYVGTANQAASASYPLKIVVQYNFVLGNGTGAQFLHVSSLGAISVCGNCYVGFVFATNATASNSSTQLVSAASGGSGINVYTGTVTSGITWENPVSVSGLLPATFYFGATPVQAFYAFARLDYAISVVTASGTSTYTTFTNTVTTLSGTTTVYTTYGLNGINFGQLMINGIASLGIDPVDAGLILSVLSIVGVIVLEIMISKRVDPFLTLVFGFLVMAVDYGFTWLPLPYFIVAIVIALGAGAMKIGKII